MTISLNELVDLAHHLGFKGNLVEFKMGVEEEWKEHFKTISRYVSSGEDFTTVAASIAVDHLNEDPYYYTKLKQLEDRKVDYSEEQRSRYNKGVED